MFRGLLSVAALFASISPWSAQALAQTPLGTAWTYQGQLKDAGSPVEGTYDLRFRVYDAALGGVQLGSLVCIDNVAVADGLFAVSLDFGAQFAGQQTFLEVDVRGDTGQNCGNSAGFATLAPRQALTGAPNALFALNANKLDGLDSTAFFQAIPVLLTLSGHNPSSHIIRGENSSTGSSSVGVYGRSTAASGATTGVYGRSDSSSGYGVYGEAPPASGINVGGRFRSLSTSGTGVFAEATATSGTTYGGYFQNASTSGMGVRGWATATSGVTDGGRFESNSTSGRGVFGLATATTGGTYGGFFQTESSTGSAVYALAAAVSGSTLGVYARSQSTGGVGVAGWADADTGETYGVIGISDSSNGCGVYGSAADVGGVTYGGRFVSVSAAGRGVYGQATATNGTTSGVYGQSESTSGRGITGYATATSGTTYGGLFQSDSTGGRGVYARAIATSGDARGVYGVSDSTSGFGSVGYATAATGTTYGVYEESTSTSGTGVLGTATAASGVTTGVSGQSDSSSGYGVFGYATLNAAATNYGGYFRSNGETGRGVYGYASRLGASDTPYGVRGQCSTGTLGYAVYAAGDMGASGVKPFRIDHPSDPESKYLLHYATESPEVLNSYRGTVALDARGDAVVELPAYFASINKSPSYQLTAVGAPMPNLHVSEEINADALAAGERAGPGDLLPSCSFRIAGGVPGAKVSWEIKAVRNDLRMRLHGAPVEREKTGPERGKYQHPEFYGQPPETGMDYREDCEQPAPPITAVSAVPK